MVGLGDEEGAVGRGRVNGVSESIGLGRGQRGEAVVEAFQAHDRAPNGTARTHTLLEVSSR